MKKLTALLLALVMAMAFSSAVLALDPTASGEGFNGVDNTAKTEVTADMDEINRTISATVPLNVTAVVRDLKVGTLAFPDSYKIINKSALPIKIIAVAAEATSPFAFEGEKNVLTLELNNVPVGGNMSVNDSSFPVIKETNGELSLALSGKIDKFVPSTLKNKGEKAFTLTYTIALAD